MTTNVTIKPEPVPVTTEAETRQAAAAPEPLAWLTLESALYGLILLLALGLRLWRLGAYPLSNIEAEQALAGLALYHGDLPAPTLYSPLLLTLNSLTFLLFGASDASARLAAVLLGGALVLLPVTLRRHLGPTVCLLASLLLAVSPSAMFLSRTLNSEMGVAAGALMVVSGFLNWAGQGQSRWLWLLAGGLALLLTAGPMSLSVILIFGLVGLANRSRFGAMAGQWLRQCQAVPASGQKNPSAENKAGNGRAIVLPPDVRSAGLFLVAAVIVLGTGATFNIGGLGRITGFITDWLNLFGLATRPDSGFNVVFLLTIYEPLMVGAGLIGLAYVMLRKDLPGMVLAVWFVGLLLLDVFMGGRPNSSLILPLVPLAFLAAIALAELWAALQNRGTWGNEGVLLATGLVIAVFGYIGLSGWLIRVCAPDDALCLYSWLQPVAALVLFLVIVIFFGIIGDAGSALRGAALTALVIGLVVTVNIGWRLNFGPLMDLAFQPLAGIPPATGLVDLTRTLTIQSETRAGDKTLLDTALTGVNSPALRWQLRNFKHLNPANTSVNGASAIITPTGQNRGLDTGQPYFGQDFTLDAVWSPVGLPAKTFVRWLIFRRLNERPAGNGVILWLRVQEP